MRDSPATGTKGVELTRNPAGLIRAPKASGQSNDVALARGNHATAAMCIDDPLQHHESRVHRLFDTHPPLADRIAALGKDGARVLGLSGFLVRDRPRQGTSTMRPSTSPRRNSAKALPTAAKSRSCTRVVSRPCCASSTTSASSLRLPQ